MNERADELGMKDTSFSDCTGLPKEGQYSCARDVAVMLRELLTKEAYYSFSKIWMDEMHHSGGRVTQMANTNKLIRNYQGCDSGKTGYTSEAGFCLAASAMRGGMRVVSVVIGAADSKTRFDGRERNVRLRVCKLYQQMRAGRKKCCRITSVKSGRKTKRDLCHSRTGKLSVRKERGRR